MAFTRYQPGARSWQVALAQFVPANQDYWRMMAGRFNVIKGQAIRGTWLKSRSFVTLTLLKRVDSKLSTLSLLQGETYEKHYISKVRFVHPQVEINDGISLQPSRVILATYFDVSKDSAQRFAVQFTTFRDADDCFKEIQNIITAEAVGELNMQPTLAKPSHASEQQQSKPFEILSRESKQACIPDKRRRMSPPPTAEEPWMLHSEDKIETEYVEQIRECMTQDAEVNWFTDRTHVPDQRCGTGEMTSNEDRIGSPEEHYVSPSSQEGYAMSVDAIVQELETMLPEYVDLDACIADVASSLVHHKENGTMSVDDDLKSHIMACLLEPEFQEYVADMEARMENIEDTDNGPDYQETPLD